MRAFSPRLLSLLLSFASITFALAQAPLPGALDTTFGNGGSIVTSTPAYAIQAEGMALTPDNKLAIAGTALSLGTPSFRAVVMQYSATGFTDTAFGPGGAMVATLGTSPLHARAIVALADGKLLVAGQSGNFLVVMRLTSTGSIDTTFGSSGLASYSAGNNAEVNAMALQSDGKILVTGAAAVNTTTSQTSLRLVRFTSTGSNDTTFGTSGSVTISHATESRAGQSLEVLASGKIMVGGYTFATALNPVILLARLNSTGQLDNTFATGGIYTSSSPAVETARAVKTDSNGDTFVVGRTTVATGADVALLKFTSAGVLDTYFSADGKTTASIGSTSDTPVDLALRADGRMFVAATTTSGTTTDFALLRFLPDGQLDASFDGDGVVTTPVGVGYDTARGLLLQADGNVIVYGTAQEGTANPVTGYAMVRYIGGELLPSTAPVITTDPATLVGAVGSPFELSVEVTSSLTPNYQWYRNGSLIPGATGPTYGKAKAVLADEGSYTVQVFTAGGRDTSEVAIVSLTGVPLIVTQPSNLTALGGSTGSFSVQIIGRPPFTYQWMKDTANYGSPTTISAESNSLSVLLDSANAGNYHVVITNAEGSVTSDTVALAVLPNPPMIVTPPQSQEILLGPGDIQISASFSGRLPVTAQWQKDGSNFGSSSQLSSNTATLSLQNKVTSAGTYRLILTNSDGTATSDPAVLTFWKNPSIVSAARQLLPSGADLVLAPRILSTLSATLYAWKHNGKSVPNGDQPSYYLSNVSLADAGSYTLSMGTLAGTTTSGGMSVAVVNASPQIVVGGLGLKTQLVAETAGDGLSFTWFKGTTAIADDEARFSGQHSAILTLSATESGDAGNYYCVVTDAEGNHVNSGELTLVVESEKPELTTSSLDGGAMIRGYSFQLTATHSANGFVVKGLPEGLTYDSKSGVISGLPTKPGSYKIEVTALNPVGASAKQVFTLTIAPMPQEVISTFTGALTPGSTDYSGVFTVTVAANATFTGKVSLSSLNGKVSSASFKGTLHEELDYVTYNGESELFNLPVSLGGRSKISVSLVPSMISVNLLQLDSSGFPTLTQSGGANYRPWNAKTHPADAYAGYYTAGMEMGFGSDATGSGPLSFSISKSGALTLAGKFIDGTAFTAPATLDAGGGIFFNAWLYGNKGRAVGYLSLSGGTAPDYLDVGVSGSYSYIRPPSTIVPLADISNTFFYGINSSVNVVGAKYLQPNIPLLTGPLMLNAGDHPDNVSVSLGGGALDTSASTSARLLSNNKVKFNDFVFGEEVKFSSLSFSPSTGTFSGTAARYYYNPENGKAYTPRQIAFQGITYRSDPTSVQAIASGFFKNTITFYFYDPDTFKIYQKFPVILSGGVSVSPQ